MKLEKKLESKILKKRLTISMIIFFSVVFIGAVKNDIYRQIKDSQRTINNVYKYFY